MRLNKIYVSQQVTDRLRVLQSRTALTPNILCRIGFCLSLREPGQPNPEEYSQDGKEFNRYTITGEHDTFYVALLKQRHATESTSGEVIYPELFRAHINRGVLILDKLVRNLSDIALLVPKNT